MKTLVEQLGAETAKNAELQSENSKLLAELEALETKLDQMARLNRDLVARTTELKTRLHSHHTGNQLVHAFTRDTIERSFCTATNPLQEKTGVLAAYRLWRFRTHFTRQGE